MDTSEMVDLRGASLEDVRKAKNLTPYCQRVLSQVEKPRANLGGAGPPGRAD